MLRSFISAGLGAPSAAHASRVASGTARSPLLSARCSPAVTSLHCPLRRSLWIRSAGLSAVVRASSSRTSLSGRPADGTRRTAIAAQSAVIGRGERDVNGFSRSADLLASAMRMETAPPALTTAAVSDPQPAPQPPASVAASQSRFFVSPVAALGHLSWLDRGLLLTIECGVAAVAIGVGNCVSLAVQEHASVLLPDVDALALLFGANALWMPTVAVVYLGLLHVLSKPGGAFTLPPIPLPGPPPLHSDSEAEWIQLLRKCLRWLGKWGPRLFIVAVVGSVGGQLMFLPSLPPVDERGAMLELSLDDQWAPRVRMALLIPVTEEVVFRGLLFARCARIIGVISAALLSSVVFGSMHGSVANSCTVMGGVVAFLYAATGNLIAPIALHMAQNYAVFVMPRKFSPMISNETRPEQRWTRSIRCRPHCFTVLSAAPLCSACQAPLDSVAQAFEAKYALCKEEDCISGWSADEKRALDSAAELEASPKDKRLTIFIAAAVFSALDRGGKDHLDASEIAWLVSTRRDELCLMYAVLGVVERRVGGDEDRLLLIQRNMDRMPAGIPLLDLPSAKFIDDEARRSFADQMGRPQSSEYDMRHLVVQRDGAGPLIPIEPRVQAMQSELLHRYYSIQWNAFYRARFPSGCDRAAFESFFCRAFPSFDDDQLRVLYALASSEECGHPVAASLAAHRAGRQSFGGVTRRSDSELAAPPALPAVVPVPVASALTADASAACPGLPSAGAASPLLVEPHRAEICAADSI